MSNNNSPVQHGLRRKDTGSLQSFWIELPGWCDLACSRCYAEGGKPKQKDQLISEEKYMDILEQARKMGVDSVGIPGAGEQFHPKVRDLTMKVIRKCSSLDIFVSVFTTAHWLLETPELVDELKGLPIELLIKGDSLDPEMQDRFVSDPAHGQIRHGFGVKRDMALKMLMLKGFNRADDPIAVKFGRPSRIALVTSIMKGETAEEPSNYDEMTQILDFCRENNLIFDCDTILKRGRGASCKLCTADQDIKAKLLELQAHDAINYKRFWKISQSYVGTSCDRFRHHLYVDQTGNVHPCIGGTEINLGNIKMNTLEEAWNHPAMLIIRNRCYGGVCGTDCLNFKEHECNSCIGRWATPGQTDEDIVNQGCLNTVGCWNNRPIQKKYK